MSTIETTHMDIDQQAEIYPVAGRHAATAQSRRGGTRFATTGVDRVALLPNNNRLAKGSQSLPAKRRWAGTRKEP